LNYCDLEFWPNKAPTVESTALHVKRRMFRWFAVSESEEKGWDKGPHVVEAVERYTEKRLLDDYHTQVLAKEVAPTVEEIRAFYEENKSDFVKHDMIDFGCILYPIAEKERAQKATDRLRQGRTWESVGQEESVILPDVRFIPATGITQGDAFPEFASMAKKLVDSGNLPLNTYSDPVEVVDTWVVFRVTSRAPGEPLAWEVAKIFITKMLVDSSVDQLLATKLPVLCEEYRLEIKEELLREDAS
ncbi:MAG: peptidylprolyl isomerase, partial [bacterium]